MVRFFRFLGMSILVTGASLTSAMAQSEFDQRLDYLSPTRQLDQAPSGPTSSNQPKTLTQPADDIQIILPDFQQAPEVEAVLKKSAPLQPIGVQDYQREQASSIDPVIPRPFVELRKEAETMMAVPTATLPESPKPYQETIQQYRELSAHPFKVMLSDRKAADGRIYLQGEFDRYHQTIYLPKNVDRVDAKIQISFTNSVELLPEGSLLNIYVRQKGRGEKRFISSIPLTAHTGQATLAFNVPQAFQGGANEIILEAVQRHRLYCTVEATYELWALIDPETSFVEFSLPHMGVLPSLSSLDEVLRSDLFGSDVLLVLRSGQVSDSFLTAGAHIAQGYSLRREKLPFKVKTISVPRLPAAPNQAIANSINFPGLDQEALPKDHLVLVGRQDQLQGIVSPRILQKIRDGFIGVYALDRDATRYIIVISGQDDGQVEQAARVFANPFLEMPARPELLIDEVGFLPQDRLPKSEYLEASSTYSLEGDLGFESEPWSGLNYQKTVPILLPPDFFVSDDTTMKLRVDAAYKNLHPDAVLTLHVNNIPVGGIPLDQMSGERIEDHVLNIPMRNFRAGKNSLTFIAYLPVQEGALCTTMGAGEPRFQLFGSTNFDLPRHARMGELPDLHLLGSGAFPYDAVRGESDAFDLYVPASDRQSLNAAFTFVGKLAVAAGRDIAVRGRQDFPTESSRNLIVIGAYNRITPNLLTGAPVNQDQMSRAWQHRAAQSFSASDQTSNLLQELASLEARQAAQNTSSFRQASAANDAQKWDSYLQEGAEVPTQSLAPKPSKISEGVSRFGSIFNLSKSSLAKGGDILYEDKGFIPTNLVMQYQSPRSPGATWTVVTAADSLLLEQGVSTLVQDGWWGHLDGTAMAWAQTEETIRLRAPEAVYHIWTGKMGFGEIRLLIGNIFSKTILLWILSAFSAILIFATLTYLVVKRVGQNALRD